MRRHIDIDVLLLAMLAFLITMVGIMGFVVLYISFSYGFGAVIMGAVVFLMCLTMPVISTIFILEELK